MIALAEQKTTDRLLQSVVTITAQRDRERLEHTLLTTFAEIMPYRRITLYQLVAGAQGEEAMIVGEVAAGSAVSNSRHGTCIPVAQQLEFRSVIESGKECVRPVQEENTFQSVYPVSSPDGIGGLLEIVSGVPADEDRRIVHALLNIYSNYLGLLLESETDTLTGLLNRRTFDRNIEKIIAERTVPDSASPARGRKNPARRKASAGAFHWLAIMDLDHFKKVNDQYGHLYGDEVLLLMAHSMRNVFRQQDKLFRFGGEEFVVVLDRTSLENAREALERFRKTIEAHDFPQIGRVTVSIGFACLAKAEVPSVMIGHADQALYYAKQNGRNQVCQYEELVSMGKLSALRYSEDMQLF